MCIYFKIRTGQRLIAINRIQNKSLCLHNVCIVCMYIFKKNVRKKLSNLKK